MDSYFKTDGLTVGYNGVPLIRDICLSIEKGKILTLIGPNGAGKTTILKTITHHLEKLGGVVYIGEKDASAWSHRDMAKQVAVMLTERIHPELMTSAEVAAMGRYPYTNFIGQLTARDKETVTEALKSVGALELADRRFATLSDGERQRIMLARAICQQPQVLVLDEPTAYLDIRYKIELIDMLRSMAQEKGITVIMSLHEIELAVKASDYIACVSGDAIENFGPPQHILKAGVIEQLYGLKSGSYDLLFGSVELSKPKGVPSVFVIAGAGTGISHYRELQKRNIPFASGILFENDIDTQVAKALSDDLVIAAPFEQMTESHFRNAAELMLRCKAVIDTQAPIGELNRLNGRLIELAAERGMPIYNKETVNELLNAEL